MSSPLPLVERICPICGCATSQLWREGTFGSVLSDEEASRLFSCTSGVHNQHFPIRVCSNPACSAKFCSPCPDEMSLAHLYSKVEDPLYESHEEARRIAARETIRRLPIRSGRLLEIGCYTGVFLEEAAREGFECYGVEPSTTACSRARARGLNVISGAFPCELPWKVDFDIIVTWDVVEHLWNPTQFFTALHPLLSPGGEVHFTTIRIDCLVARLMGGRWPWYMPMHLLYFERTSIETMLAQSGFAEPVLRPNFHYTDIEYLRGKLATMAFPLNYMAPLLRLVPVKRARIALGDTVYVSAAKRTPGSKKGVASPY